MSLSLSRENQADIIEAFNSSSRYLIDLLNIDNIYFEHMVDWIYPAELQLNKANSSDTEAPFLDLNLSRGMSCYSEHLSSNLNISQQEQVSVILSTYITCRPSAIYPW